jgi:hypothetical protein
MINIKNVGNNQQDTTDKVAEKAGQLASAGIKHAVAGAFGIFQGAKHAFKTYRQITKQ